MAIVKVELKFMGKRPGWVRDIYLSDKPTELDSEGVQGFYVERIVPKFWAWPVLSFQVFLRLISKKLRTL